MNKYAIINNGIIPCLIIFLLFSNAAAVPGKLQATQKVTKSDPIIGAWVTPFDPNKTPADLFIAKESKRVDWVNIINNTSPGYPAERWFLGKWQKRNETTYTVQGEEIISYGMNSSHSPRKVGFNIRYNNSSNTLTGIGEKNSIYRKISKYPIIPEGINAVIPFD